MSPRAVALIIAMIGLLVVTPVQAITSGWPDDGAHPNVGALVGTFEDETYPYCSGTLISSTVFLTAAHCDISEETETNRVEVTFDEVFDPDTSTTYEGTFIPDPAYSQRQNDPHDIAIVRLDNPITTIPLAQLPTLNAFANLKKNQAFTAVGYGATERLKEPGQEFFYPDARNYAVSTLNAVNKAWLQLSMNPSTGDGGTCYGDSGGPNFFGSNNTETDIIAGITITGDSVCRATNVIYRLDTASARAFLSANGVAVPTAKADKNKANKDRNDKQRRGHRR